MAFVQTLEEMQRRELPGGGHVWLGELPESVRITAADFETLWAIHPADYHEIVMHGRLMKTPRWQQAYGEDYRYTGNVNRALPVPPQLEPFLTWVREAIDPRCNGLLLNWYAGEHRHYIGPHRDSATGLVPGAPIVTISLGEARPWRIRPWKGRGFEDLEARDGTVIVLPWETNLAYTHEVTAPAGARGRRISITLRAFAAGIASA